jgi:hypothetical protein
LSGTHFWVALSYTCPEGQSGVLLSVLLSPIASASGTAGKKSAPGSGETRSCSYKAPGLEGSDVSKRPTGGFYSFFRDFLPSRKSCLRVITLKINQVILYLSSHYYYPATSRVLTPYKNIFYYTGDIIYLISKTLP